MCVCVTLRSKMGLPVRIQYRNRGFFSGRVDAKNKSQIWPYY